GFYNMAWQLIIFPLAKINPIVNKVAFPVYSKVQTDSAALNRYYSLSIRLLSIITMPLLAFLLFFSEDVVWIIFGDGWEETAALLPAFALVGILKALSNPGGALLLALGRADIGFWWNLIWAGSIFVGLTVGLSILPSAQTAVFVLLALSLTVGMVWHVLIARIAKVEYLPIVIHFLRLFVVVIGLGWSGSLAVVYSGLDNAILRITLGVTVYALL